MTAHALINGRSFPIDVDGDMDEHGRAFGIFRWEDETPECPRCHEPLITDDRRPKVPMRAVGPGDFQIECACCDARVEVNY